jgi:hypothetical protein
MRGRNRRHARARAHHRLMPARAEGQRAHLAGARSRFLRSACEGKHPSLPQPQPKAGVCAQADSPARKRWHSVPPNCCRRLVICQGRPLIVPSAISPGGEARTGLTSTWYCRPTPSPQARPSHHRPAGRAISPRGGVGVPASVTLTSTQPRHVTPRGVTCSPAGTVTSRGRSLPLRPRFPEQEDNDG